MDWYLQLAIGFLIGLSLSNATVRHHALTLVIWIFKATNMVSTAIIWCCEYLQDRFDDINISTKIHTTKTQNKSGKFDFNTATDEQIREYIQKHPGEVKVKVRGGE